MKEADHAITTNHLTVTEVFRHVLAGGGLTLSEDVQRLVAQGRDYLDAKIDRHDQPIYGINTGFGSLCNTEISRADLEELQENLVRSHAAGIGRPVPEVIVRLMLFLKIQGLSYGHSGIQPATLQRLVDFYNHGVLPVIYESGSLGASGDLAPLAHLSLPLLGEGRVYRNATVYDTADVLEEFGWEPLKLKSKEGLALLNGTQFMSAYGVYIAGKAQQLVQWADRIAALSLDAFDGRPEPFSPLPHRVRKQPGQVVVASHIREILEDSELFHRPKQHVQDPYSFRCIPQVHGAIRDALAYVIQVVENEINSVTDNPTVFPEEDEVVSAGNFHGEPLALALDHVAVLLAELASISERRTYKLISGQRSLPAFLVAEPGLHSGFMIPQYTAASLVSKNKQLCTPASVDTIDSSNGQEDHVSMGANAAVKALEVLENTERVLAIEWFNACQALEFRRPARSSQPLENWVREFRERVPFVEQDCIMHEPMQASVDFLREKMLSE